MKPFCLAAIALLLFTFYSSTHGQRSIHKPEKCCFSFFKSRIPAKQVEHFEITPPDCKHPAVIFHTTKQEICADPAEKWVQRLTGIVKDRVRGDTAATVSGDSV